MKLRAEAVYAFPLCLVFLITLNYSGAGFNLHWLSLGVGLLVVWLSHLLIAADTSRFFLSQGWLLHVMLGYLAWLWVAPFLSTYHYASSTTAMGLAVLPLTFVAWLLVPTEITRRVWPYVYGMLLTAALGIAAWGIVDFSVWQVRAHALFLDPNAYAALINLFLLPVSYDYLNASGTQVHNKRSLRLLAIVSVLAVAQFMSLSRGALISFAATFPMLVWFSRHSSPRFRERSLMLVAVIAMAHVGVKFAPVDQKNGIEDFLSAPQRYVEQDTGIQERILLWKSTWKMYQDANPVVGNGLGSFKIYYAAYRDENETSLGNFAHNDYLQALHDGGLVQFGFFLVLTVFTPLAILLKNASDNRSPRPAGSAPGLMMGILCVSAHSLVNFIHFIGPIIFLCGLYIAHAWEGVQPAQRVSVLHILSSRVNPLLQKGLIIVLLALPTAALAVDGIIFRLFATSDAFYTRLDPTTRFELINLALSIRPSNPMPRILLTRALIDRAEKTHSPDERNMMLDLAEKETKTLSVDSPALAIGSHFFSGRILAMRGGTENLFSALQHFERATRLVPPATAMRLELLRMYERLGKKEEAIDTIKEAKKWIKLETDLASLTRFAFEANSTLLRYGEVEESRLWSWIHVRLTTLGYGT